MIDSPVATIVKLFRQRGNSRYGGEAVTQLEHALQTATLAEQEGAGDSLVAAALLHDVGHLLHHLPDDAPDHDIDDCHETVAAKWLARFFPPEVVEPVRLHVAAKRYLCTVDPTYQAQLSGPSLQSLQLQGGPMNTEEVASFQSGPHGKAAVRLRRWDETAKVAGLKTPDLEHFIPSLEVVQRGTVP